MENDFDTDFETTDLDTDFDSTEPTESVKDRQGDATDAVAALLMGDDSALDNIQSGDGKSFNMGHIRDTDSTRSERPAKDETPAYMNNQSAPDVQSAQGRLDHFTAQAEAAERQWQELQQMKDDLTPEQFAYQQQYLQGQAAGAMLQAQQAELEVMRNQQWLKDQEARVMQKHGSIFNDPAKREFYSKKMLDVLGEVGYSGEELSNISGREYSFVLDHILLKEERDKLKLENAKYKAEHRKRQQSLKRGKRDIEAGAGRSKKGGSDVYDEVARVLMTPRRG